MYKILSFFLIFTTLLFANIGTVTLVEGDAFVLRDSNSKKLNLGDTILNQDIIETKMNSKAKITFVDDTVITIGKESSLNIEDYYFSSSEPSKVKTQLSITKGTFHAITGQIGKVNPSKFKLKTKNATIGIRGTEFFGDETKVLCTKGAISVESFGTIIEVQSGFFVDTFEQKVPSEVRVIEKQQLQEVDSNLSTSSSKSSEIIKTTETSTQFENTSSPIALAPQKQVSAKIDNKDSWGHWENNFQDESNNSKKDKDISEENNNPNKPNNPTNPDVSTLTDVRYVQNLMDATTVKNLSFSGKIDVPGVTATASRINLNLKFGNNLNNVNGSYGFNHAGGDYNGSLTGTINPNGFTATDRRSPTNLTGSFYGAEINKVAGSINLENATGNKLNGTFDATRK